MTSRIGARRLLAAAAVALLAAFPATALAHADLVRAIPADGSTVTDPVTVVSGRYSQDLTSASSLKVLDASAATVATGVVDPGDDRRMLARADVPLTDGTYTVQSTAISAEDGDIERVTWTFTVEVAATPAPMPSPTVGASAPPTTSPTPEATPSAAPSASPTPSAEPSAPTSSTADVLLPIVAALALVLILAGFLLNRSRAGR
jgi:copper resistance protein C